VAVVVDDPGVARSVQRHVVGKAKAIRADPPRSGGAPDVPGRIELDDAMVLIVGDDDTVPSRGDALRAAQPSHAKRAHEPPIEGELLDAIVVGVGNIDRVTERRDAATGHR
jgi:hypothetical protein